MRKYAKVEPEGAQGEQLTRYKRIEDHLMFPHDILDSLHKAKCLVVPFFDCQWGHLLIGKRYLKAGYRLGVGMGGRGIRGHETDERIRPRAPKIDDETKGEGGSDYDNRQSGVSGLVIRRGYGGEGD